MVYFFMGGLGSNLDLVIFKSQSPSSAFNLPAKAALANTVIPRPTTAMDVPISLIILADFMLFYFQQARVVTQPPACIAHGESSTKHQQLPPAGDDARLRRRPASAVATAEDAASAPGMAVDLEFAWRGATQGKESEDVHRRALRRQNR